MASESPGIGKHYLRYSSANILVLLAGLVSFPIMTRLLDNTQYGILGYYDTWVLMAVAIAKLGAQHSILRFYPHGGDSTAVRAFATNLFYLPLLVSLVLWVLTGTGIVVTDWFVGATQSPVFWMAMLMIPAMVYSSLVETVLRATERSRTVMFTRIAWRYLQLLLMVGAVVAIQHTALVAYAGKLVSALLGIAFYVFWAHRNLGFSRQALDPGSLKQSMAFGMPLVATEMLSVALVSVDRLMLKGLSGDFAVVGIYSIGAGLAMQVHMFMNLTVFESFTPMANRLFVTENAAAVRALKLKMLLPMTYAAVGISIALLCLGTDVIIALSGAGKAASGPVFAVIGATNAVLPVMLVCGYGLMLEKRTRTVFALGCTTVLLNTALNFVLIPRYGFMGASYATVASSFVAGIGHCMLVSPTLRQLPDRRTLAVAGVAAVVAAICAWGSLHLGLRPGWQRLIGAGLLIGGPYLATLLLLDPRLRAMLPMGRKAPQGTGESLAG
ncbi:oligosaccharide flippase family protein [Lysobacter sp. TAF61]|uniref:lipopolysaccharide biosynthesis protein n=1 Tax=Lysobacter sp. TAF61 TaxID=3233072 RepID=UPI003F9DB4E2